MACSWTRAILVALPLAVASMVPASAQPVPDFRPDMAARIEMIPIPTLTLTDEQFLRGDSYGVPATIAGVLRVARGTGRLPLVVFVPGSAGHAPNTEVWSDLFLALGVSTFAIDPLAGRGVTSVGASGVPFGRLTSIVDLYQSLSILADHPRVDPDRIIVMGASRGANAALYAGLNRFDGQWNHSGVRPAAFVALYPSCFTSFVDDTLVSDRPIEIFHGTAADTLVPIQPCRDYVQRLAAAGADATLTEMPGATHGFDSPNFPRDPPLAVAQAPFNHCIIQEGPVGVLVNTETNQRFTPADACVGRGTSLAYSPSATETAQTAVTELARTVFQLSN